MEFKLRAWNEQDKEMEYIDDLYWFEEEGIHDSEGQGHYRNYKFMLAIGFNDKNNKEIYEGDVLLLTSKDHQCYDEYKSIVEFKNGGFYPFVNTLVSGRGTHADIYELYDFEVIGNIYETPELLSEV